MGRVPDPGDLVLDRRLKRLFGARLAGWVDGRTLLAGAAAAVLAVLVGATGVIKPLFTATTVQVTGAAPDMVALPGGNFLMGSAEDEPGRRLEYEGPRHSVTVRPFAMAKYEVTFADWDACVADGGCDGNRLDDRGWGRGRQPAINVGWDDARAYARWLSQKTGHTYRLPTEAEWEYAARAGSTTAYWWGAAASHEYANYGKDECCGGLARGRDSWVNTSPAGSFPPNAFGLHDMHGNVWEWVEDCWNDGYQGAPSGDEAWTTGDCKRRVVRGGSWSNLPRDLRSATRSRYGAGNRSGDLGFRLARTLP
ncbi:MAG: formylglycine-generating enzyme family protein [Alphaproteobacteria bacterium]|nr:formylglycine-generating enzyme family protein [Alphaproteobacteria bacterium]